jgi:hypothetical protein
LHLLKNRDFEHRKSYFWVMKNALIVLVAATVLGFTLQSCENEIELNAPYKETGIVYGILDPKLGTQTVRIQKAFLGEGNALIMSQNPDSIYYPEDALDVKLYRLNGNNLVNPISLVRFEAPPKPDGAFPTTPNYLYGTSGQTISKGSTYRLVIRNLQTGNEITAETQVVDSITITRPNLSEKINWATYQDPYTVRHTTTPSGRIYGLTIRFHYREIYSVTDSVEKYVDWVFPNRTLTSDFLSSNAEETRIINGEDFYRNIALKLSSNPGFDRRALKMDFIVTFGSEFLANYIEINQPNTNLLTTPPVYTNVQNGLGIFSSRSSSVRYNKELHPSALDSLRFGQYTGSLGFL